MKFFSYMLLLSLVVVAMLPLATATIYFEAPCDNTINYGGTDGSGGTFSYADGKCTLEEIDGGSAAGHYYNVTGVPTTGIVYMDIKNWRVSNTATSAWISIRNVTDVDVMIFQNQFGGILNDDASGFVHQGGYVEVILATPMVESPTEYRNITVAMNYDNQTFTLFVNETIQFGVWEPFEEADGGEIKSVDFLTNSYGTGQLTWEGMCFRDSATAFGCPAATGPVLNITIFSPDQDLHHNTDLVAVFNTTSITNGTCSLSVGGFVKDSLTSINSSASNYTLTWSPVTEGNNSWFINCVDTGELMSTPDSVLTVTGVQHGNASNLTVQDGSYLHIDEATGTPGMEVIMNWTNLLDEPENGNFYLNYVGSPSHEFNVQGWNGTGWEGQGNFTDEGGFFWLNFSATAPSSRFVVDNQVSVRLYHADSGNQNHDLFIDYAELGFSLSTNAVQTSTQYYYVDTTDPVINNIKPVSGEDINTASYALNIQYTDTYVSQTETNISCGRTQIYYNKSTSLGESFNVTNTTSFGNIESQCLGQFRVADEHTAKHINDFYESSTKDTLSYVTDQGLGLSIKADDAITSVTSKVKDRYTFEYSYLSLMSTRRYHVISEWPLLNNDLRSYPAFVALNPAGFGGHWVDFNTRDIKSYEVTRVNDKYYVVDITFNTLLDAKQFDSVGGLNTAEKNVTFNVDTLAPRVWTGPRQNISTTTNTSFKISANITDASLSTGKLYTNETGAWTLKHSWTATNGTQLDYVHTFSKGGLIKWGVCATDNFSNTGCDDNFTVYLNVSLPQITLNAPETNFSSPLRYQEFNVRVTQTVPMPDTLTLYTDESGSMQPVQNSTWVSGVDVSLFHTFTTVGVYQWQVTANDTLGNSITSENRTINISVVPYRGVFKVGTCPDDSVQDVMMFMFMFIIIIIIYVVSYLYLRMPFIEIGCGVAMILFAFPLFACMTMIGGLAVLFGSAMILSGFT